MKAHFDAFKALLLAVAILANKVYANIRVTNGQPVRQNYIVLFPTGPDDLDDNRYSAPQEADSRSRWRYDVRVVAVDADGLMLLADAVMSLIGKVPVVAGRKCERVKLVRGVEEGKGRYDSTTDLHYLDISLEFWSGRA